MEPGFLNREQPLRTVMIQTGTPGNALRTICRAVPCGCRRLCVQEHDALSTKGQPAPDKIRTIRDCFAEQRR